MKSTKNQKTRDLTLRLFSNATKYGIGMILVKMGGFIVLPVYLNLLTPEDFGRITLSQVLSLLFVPLFDLGISGSVQRHYFEWDEVDRPHYLAALLTFSFSISLVLSVLLSFLSDQILHFFAAEMTVELVLFGVWTSFFLNCGIISFSLYRIREQLHLYTYLSLLQFFAQTVCTIILIYFFQMQYKGYLWGALLGASIYGIVSLIMVLKEIKFPWNWAHLKAPLSYALPAFPGGVLEGLGAILDRFFLQSYISIADLGIYSIGRQFGQMYNFFVATLKNSWVPLVFRLASENQNASKVISRLSQAYLIILLIPALVISTVSSDLIFILNNSQYFAVSQYVPYFVAVYILYGIGNIYGRGLDLAKKTKYYWVVYAVNLVSNISLLYLWAPRYGIWGAIAAILTSGILREAVLITLATYFYPKRFNPITIFITVIVNGTCYLILQNLPIKSGWTSLFLKLVIITIFVSLNVYLVYGKDGIAKIKQIIKSRNIKL